MERECLLRLEVVVVALLDGEKRVEDGFESVVVMVVDYLVDYTTGLLVYKDRRYFIGTPALETGGAGVEYVGECGEIRYISYFIIINIALYL